MLTVNQMRTRSSVYLQMSQGSGKSSYSFFSGRESILVA